MTWDERLDKMRASGEVKVSDFFPPLNEGRRPYRYASLVIQSESYALLISALATLAVEIDGHLQFYSHTSPPSIHVAISRDLGPEELVDAPTASRKVR